MKWRAPVFVKVHGPTDCQSSRQDATLQDTRVEGLLEGPKNFLDILNCRSTFTVFFFLLLCVCACVGDSVQDETRKNESSSSTTFVTCGLLIHSIDQC